MPRVTVKSIRSSNAQLTLHECCLYVLANIFKILLVCMMMTNLSLSELSQVNVRRLLQRLAMFTC